MGLITYFRRLATGLRYKITYIHKGERADSPTDLLEGHCIEIAEEISWISTQYVALNFRVGALSHSTLMHTCSQSHMYV